MCERIFIHKNYEKTNYLSVTCGQWYEKSSNHIERLDIRIMCYVYECDEN